MKKIISSLITTSLVASFALVAHADDAALGGRGANVEVIQNDQIQMVEETILIDVYPGGEFDWESMDWDSYEDNKLMNGYVEYDVTYLFNNDSDEEITATIGFPEVCDWGCEYDYDMYKLQDLETTMGVSGNWTTIERNFQETDQESPEFGTRNWYVAEVKFPPGESEIRNTYWVIPAAYKAGSRWNDYILDTGASWKGVIESVDVIVTMHDSLSIYDFTALSPAGYEFDREYNRVKWHFSDLEPTEDDNIQLSYRDRDADEFTGETCKWDGPNLKDISSSYLVEGDWGYYACFVTDNDDSTAWVEGVEGDGVGEWIKIDLLNNVDYEKVEIFNGYGESEDLWKKNGRIKDVLLTYSNGEQHRLTLEDMYGSQIIDLPKPISFPVESGVSVLREDMPYVIVEIQSVYPGSVFEDTALSEMRFLGLVSEAIEGSEMEGLEGETEESIEAEIEAEVETEITEELDEAMIFEGARQWVLVVIIVLAVIGGGFVLVLKRK